jgi:hypothetical protein
LLQKLIVLQVGSKTSLFFHHLGPPFRRDYFSRLQHCSRMALPIILDACVPSIAGEMIVGPKNTLFLDEISTGLDSSTTFLIVRCMRNFVHTLQARPLTQFHLRWPHAVAYHVNTPDESHRVSAVAVPW